MVPISHGSNGSKIMGKFIVPISTSHSNVNFHTQHPTALLRAMPPELQPATDFKVRSSEARPLKKHPLLCNSNSHKSHTIAVSRVISHAIITHTTRTIEQLQYYTPCAPIPPLMIYFLPSDLTSLTLTTQPRRLSI